ncbi:Bug family tripartite tricarboxylate transporter substrate binding protein [Bradyrhizobium icense]|nr:tripartite tricarboxylate transporter substrate binding protein [Bradyrhizobium icense]
MVGEKLGDALGKAVVTDNRPGAGGTTGLIGLARSTADGHTLGVGATGALVINPHVPELGLNFNPLRELTPIAKLIDIPLVLVTHPGSGFRTLPEMISQSKDRSGGIAFGSTGTNSSQHLSVELLKKATGANLVHVPYRGSAPAMTDLLGEQIQMASVDLTSAAAHIKAGKVIALAVTSSKRVELAPEIPTIAQSAVPGFDVSAWMGMFGPAGLAATIVEQVSGHLRTALSDDAFRSRVRNLACVEAFLGPHEFSEFLERESTKMRALVQSG